ncbi:MAG: hypothetical protein NTNFB02_34030 [Nitrospira sp.]
MMFPRRQEKGQVSRILLALIVGLTLTIVAPDDSLARAKKDTIYNVCGCACQDPVTGFGELLLDIQNTAGVPCGAYNNRACTLTAPDGATRAGTTKFCTGDVAGGTRAMLSTIPNAKLSVIGRGVEGEPSKQDNESAALTSEPGNVMMNCSCESGNGSCSVTSKDGKTSTCHKGDVDTCTGTCAYPKGTISGE